MRLHITTPGGLDLHFDSIAGQWSGESKDMAAALNRNGLAMEFAHDTPVSRALRTVRGYGFADAVAEITGAAAAGEIPAGADTFKT